MKKFITLFSIVLLLSTGIAFASAGVMFRGVKITSGVFVNPSPYNKYYIDNNGLVAWYPLDEGIGSSTYDWSGYGNNGTWHGTATGTSGYYSAGKVGAFAGAFDGTSTYINATNSVSLNPTSVSVAAWVNQLATSTNFEGIVAKDVSGSVSNPPYALQFLGSDSIFMFSVNNQSNTNNQCQLQNTASSPTLGTWNYLVATYSIATQSITLYLNGSVVSGSGTCTGIANMATSTNSVRVGQQKLGNLRFFNGYLDDVRIYNRVLTATEVASIYNYEKGYYQ